MTGVPRTTREKGERGSRTQKLWILSQVAFPTQKGPKQVPIFVRLSDSHEGKRSECSLIGTYHFGLKKQSCSNPTLCRVGVYAQRRQVCMCNDFHSDSFYDPGAKVDPTQGPILSRMNWGCGESCHPLSLASHVLASVFCSQARSGSG